MGNIMKGTVKFIHPKGFGFAKTETEDVSIHVANFRRPAVIRAQKPEICYLKIEPEDISLGDEILMEVEQGEKGLVAVMWWLVSDEEKAEKELESLSLYQIISREIVMSKPYGNNELKCWMVDQTLQEEIAFLGYSYQLSDFKPLIGRQYRIEQFIEEWEACSCPFGQYNGGLLFELTLDWKDTRRVA